ncbi:MAG TPA: peptidoglycan DD-metalloendopeptidase family protein [Candidatus Saccharimonadales bacterium]|nr:peptidoglycan DD-metalloendopeptidase family protein [Candidatus Saccharimonadales bacterium]
MRRRPHLAITLLALVMVGSSLVTTSPRDLAQASDPLADAKAQQLALEHALAQQRDQLSQLKATSAALSDQLSAAEAELASVTAEYDRVAALLVEVQGQVADITARLKDLNAQIASLDTRLAEIAHQIVIQTAELRQREQLLQDHLRAAYERTQTSLLEILLSAKSFDSATSEVGYLLTVSDQDQQLADQISTLRAELQTQQQTLSDGRQALAKARDVAKAEAADLATREAQLADMQKRLAELKVAADQKRAEQEAALNAALQAKGNVEAQIQQNEAAFKAQTALVAKLQAEADARNRAPSAFGFRWPEDQFQVTQEFGPTTFVLEPPYVYNGVYYPHFHTGIDISHGCGTPIHAVGDGTVVASGRPLWPWDSAYGVYLDHGGGYLTVYWHLQARVVVTPGQEVKLGQVIGYEGNTGNTTGCHLHFAVNDQGVWQNPRHYLP